MDFLYVPTQYSSESYSSLVDSETANNTPGLCHSSDSSSRCSTPKSFDRGWDLEPVPSLSEAVWNPVPRYEDHPIIGTSAPHATTKDGNLELFGVRHGSNRGSEDPLAGNSFDSLMRGLEHQSYSDIFSYAPAYEPLNWSLPPSQPQGDNWLEMSSSNGLLLPAPQPVRADLNNEHVLLSLESQTYPTAARATSRASSVSSTPKQGPSSLRYHPLAIRREAPRGSAPRSKDSDAPAYQHICSTCSCKFARARDLTRHFRLHTGERPYECSGCNERFIRVDARKRHWNNHPRCHAVHKNLNA